MSHKSAEPASRITFGNDKSVDYHLTCCANIQIITSDRDFLSNKLKANYLRHSVINSLYHCLFFEITRTPKTVNRWLPGMCHSRCAEYFTLKMGRCPQNALQRVILLLGVHGCSHLEWQTIVRQSGGFPGVRSAGFFIVVT